MSSSDNIEARGVISTQDYSQSKLEMHAYMTAEEIAKLNSAVTTKLDGILSAISNSSSGGDSPSSTEIKNAIDYNGSQLKTSTDEISVKLDAIQVSLSALTAVFSQMATSLAEIAENTSQTSFVFGSAPAKK